MSFSNISYTDPYTPKTFNCGDCQLKFYADTIGCMLFYLIIAWVNMLFRKEIEKNDIVKSCVDFVMFVIPHIILFMSIVRK